MSIASLKKKYYAWVNRCLLLGARRGDEFAIKMSLALGADVNSGDPLNGRPLGAALYIRDGQKRFSTINTLLDAGAETRSADGSFDVLRYGMDHDLGEMRAIIAARNVHIECVTPRTRREGL